MYSTCLYCSRDFGTNTILEFLPVGRRIAFDESTGRLWVVCRGCDRWNLVPFDSRLETIEECEELFRDARLKFSTDNIGIARLREGLELVRIGRAERQEFAAWRYGDQFGRRRRKQLAVWSGLGVLTVGAVVGRHFLAPWMALPAGFMQPAFQAARGFYRNSTKARVTDANGSVLRMSRDHIDKVALTIDDGGGMAMEIVGLEGARRRWHTSAKSLVLTGDAVVPALGQMLPSVNTLRGTRQAVRDAVDLLGDHRTADRLIIMSATPRNTPQKTPRFTRLGLRGRSRAAASPHAQLVLEGDRYLLRDIPPTDLLALEMLAHEETERIALGGELKLLERQWREADKLAKIADQLALPEDVDEALEARRAL